MACYKRQNKKMTITAETEALKVFKDLDPDHVAKASGAVFNPETKDFSLTYCTEEYLVSHPDGKVRFRNSSEEVPELERTILLQYLSNACGLPPRGHWLTFIELPDGAHHNVPFQLEACVPIANTFGENLELFKEVGKQLGGEELKMGDAAFKLKVLPKIDLAYMLWEGDEEFPAKANVLFEGVSPTYLTTAWLYCLGIEVALKIVGRANG